MPAQCRRRVMVLGIVGLMFGVATMPPTARGADPSPEAAAFFEQKVRPIFQESCFSCHSHAAKKSKGGLMLDSRAAILQGGGRGPAIVSGKPDESVLMKAVDRHDEDLKMPPTKKLTADQVAILREWVQRGAPWAGGSAASTTRPPGTITNEDRQWWAFQSVRAVEPPDVRDPDWRGNAIDRFVRAKLDAAGLTPAPPADRRSLIRRVTFDLIGLPPTPREIEAFVDDQSTDAYEKLVDRLLESPRYGERMGRLWLDVARYAETDGFKADDDRPGAWRYRDYVIESFNADKRYDRFIKEQLAGDEIAPDDPAALVATGFLRGGVYEYNNRDAPAQWDSILNELTDTVGDAFLAMGMGCARCHDHKFDPILQNDYFRLKAFFAGLSSREDIPIATEKQQAEYRAKLGKWENETKEIRAKIEALEAPVRAKLERDVLIKMPEEIQAILAKPAGERTAQEHQIADLSWRQVTYEFRRIDVRFKGEAKQTRDQLRKDLAKFDADRPVLPEGLAARDVGPVAAPIVRSKTGTVVEPGVPSVFDPNPLPVAAGRATTGRRTTLAEWLTRPENPLTARVAVNRIWQQHFGRGLVGTSSDFGKLGELPSHPELLDWLTKQFVDGGWHFKALHREILLSQAYRQSATHPVATTAIGVDPENRLLWHAATRRLEAEQVRDSLLAVGGRLDLTVGGPSVAAAEPRRTVYTKAKRNLRDPLLDLFDAPESFASASQRNVTTTPMQALLMVNSPFMVKQAELLAGRLQKEQPADETGRLDAAYRLTLGRLPTDAERRQAVVFLDEQAKQVKTGDGRDAAWMDFCHVLLNASEFLYVD
jgi:hypothetical protein